MATVDATEISERLLGRTPPPVGITMLGAYARITEAVDMAALSECIRDTFPGNLGERNAQGALEAYEKVEALGGVQFQTERRPARIQHAEISSLPQYYSFDRYDKLPGFSKGSPFVWRDKVPVCNDGQCICPGSCISEVMCPDGTGFIVREGLLHQGYRIDVDFCRGCGICVEVCVGHALTMVDEDQLRKERPSYEEVTVEPHWPEVSGHQRAGMEALIPLRLREEGQGQGGSD